MKSPLRVLVTGGAGFIGSHLVETLVEQGHEVAVADDLSAGSKGNIKKLKVWWYLEDITLYKMLTLHFEVFKPEIVFHNAASKSRACEADPNRDLEVNAGGTLALLRLSLEHGVKKFIHASTGSVYGLVQECPVTEDHPTKPITYYGVSKLVAEKYALLFHRRFGLDVTVLRYFHVYGPRQRCADDAGGVVGIFCRRALEGLPLVVHGDGEQLRSFTYVKDVVRANLMAMEGGAGRVYNVASGQSESVLSLAHRVIALNGGGRIEHGEARPGDIRDWVVSNEAIAEIGMGNWTSLGYGLKETFEWYANR